MREKNKCFYCGRYTEGNRKCCKRCYDKYRLLPRFTQAVKTIKKELCYGRKKGN